MYRKLLIGLGIFFGAVLLGGGIASATTVLFSYQGGTGFGGTNNTVTPGAILFGNYGLTSLATSSDLTFSTSTNTLSIQNINIAGTCTGCGGAPGGSDTDVQYNSGGNFTGTSDFVFNEGFNGQFAQLVLGLAGTYDGEIRSPDSTIPDTNGPDMDIISGNALGNANGGQINADAGNADQNGTGGAMAFAGGNGGAVSGDGGQVQFQGGFAVSGNGGNIFLAPGGTDGGGAVGMVQVEDPTSGLTAAFDASGLNNNRTFTFPNFSGTFTLGSGFTPGDCIDAADAFTIQDAGMPCSAGGGSFAYPFPSNATSTKLDLSGGIQVAALSGFVGGNGGTLYSFASSSITTLSGLSLPYTQLTGVPAFDTFAYPFPNAATSTLLTFTGGILVNNSTSTITNLVTVGATSTSATTTSFDISSYLKYGSSSGCLQATGGVVSILGSNCDTNAGTVTNVSTTYPITGGTITTTGTIGFQGLSTTSPWTSGSLAYVSNGNTLTSVATTTVSCSGTTSCSPFTVIGSSPVTISSSGGGGSGVGTIATSSSETKGQIPYFTTTAGYPALVGSVATSSVTNGSGIAFSATPGALIGGSNFSISASGLTTSNFASANVSQWTNDANYLTANQSITLSGAVTGSGATSITTTFENASAGTVLDNPTGSTGTPAFNATSTLFGTGIGGYILGWNNGKAQWIATSSINNGVTSVAASVPSVFSISGSPITTSGTLAISYSGTALPVANGGTDATSFVTPLIVAFNGTSLIGTSTPAATEYNATSTIATSTFLGQFNVGTSTVPVSNLGEFEVDISNLITGLGGLIIQTVTNVASAFTITNAAGTKVLNVDDMASNAQELIGTSSPAGGDLSAGELNIFAPTGATLPWLFKIASTTGNATTTPLAVYNSGWIVTSGTLPTASSCGSTQVVSGNQTQGSVVFTGTLVTSCTINFPIAVPPNTTLQCVPGDNTTAITVDISATTTSSITFGISSGISGATLTWSCGATRNDNL